MFSIGWLSFVLATLCAVLYLVGRQVRRFGAWVQNDEGPRERAGAMMVIAALCGFIAGGLGQPIWDKAMTCKQQGQPIFACALLAAPTR